MSQGSSSTAISLMGLLIGLGFALVCYVFVCFCLRSICKKAGHDPGILIWIPIANLIPMLTVAKLPIWFIILFLIPLVNLVVAIIMWVKICEARGKPGWLGILMIVPLANIGLILYLAFAD